MTQRCPHCGSANDVPPHMAGVEVVCLACREPFIAERPRFGDAPSGPAVGGRAGGMRVGGGGVTFTIDRASLRTLLPRSTVGCAALALILFFMPWLEVSCSGNVILTQTGAQVVFGDVTASTKGSMSQLEAREGDKDSSEPLLGLFPFGLVIGALASLRWALGGSGGNRWAPAIGMGLALVVLLGYQVVGFRVERKLEADLERQLSGARSFTPPDGVEPEQAAAMSEQMTQMMAASLKVDRTGYYVVALIATLLGAATAVAAGSLQEERRFTVRYERDDP